MSAGSPVARGGPLGFRLYAVTDPGLCGADLVAAVREAILGGAAAVQLRDKSASSLELYRHAVRLRELTAELGALLIVNDRLDVALAVEADGLHVGDADLPAERVRPLWQPPRLLGVTAGTPEAARLAESHGADYVGVGPAFVSRTKRDGRAALGPEGLEAVVHAAGVPVVAIGGIDESNAGLLAGTGVAAIAAAAGIFADARGPRAAAAAVLEAFETAPGH
jgi:thiamine-phosphate pyrophosphorylase